MQVEQAAPAETPDASAAIASAPVSAPVSTPAQAAPQEAPQAQPSPESSAEPTPSAREPTLLEKFDTEQAAKESKAEGDTAKEPAKAEAEAAAEPDAEPAKEPAAAPEPHVWEELALPEGFTKRLDIPEAEVNKRIGELNDVLLKDINPNARRSELMALHTKALQEYADKVKSDQANAWNEYNKNQVLSTMSDSELGGAGHNTAMGAVARVRDEITRGWSKPNKQQLNEFLIATGAGSHPAFLRLMHSAAKFIDEPHIPNITPSPTKENGVRETGQGGRKSRVLYDNPRST